MLEGEVVDKTFGFVDLLGTKYLLSKYLKKLAGDSSDSVDQATLTRIQVSFASAFLSAASQFPNVTVAQASDSAFIIGDDPNEVIDLISYGIVYTSFYFNPSTTPIIPLRAGIAKGLIKVSVNNQALQATPNFSCLPYIGDQLS